MTQITQRPLRPGAYAATLTFFDPQTLDIDVLTLQRHIKRLADAGLAGIIALGSNGEAAHLNSDERDLVVKTIAKSLDIAGYSTLPIVVGASAPSVRGTVALCHEAKAAGGSHVLVLPPSYFVGAMSPDVIFEFYQEVAERSPLPVIIYSFPAVTANITMDSDLIIRISKAHPNIVGTKFTCGDTGKLARVARAMDTMTPTKPDQPYWAVAGLADFALQGLVAGASGVIAGGGNVLPKTIVSVYNHFTRGEMDLAMELQSMLAEGDWPHTGAGISATKAILEHAFGYGGPPRPPLQVVKSEKLTLIASAMTDILKVELGGPKL